MSVLPAASRSVFLLAVSGVLAAVLLFWNGAAKHEPAPKPAGKDAAAAPSWTIVGRQGLELGGFNQPRGITAFPDGSFVVADRSARVQHFSADGKPLALWIMQEHALGNPKGLAALPNGGLLVCDTHYGRVMEMSIEGKVVRQWGGPGKEPGQFVHPLSCAVDARAGVAYVVEYGAYNDRVQKFKLDGTFIKAWGGFGSEPGRLNRPSGVAVDRQGCVWVADACNHRIQKFDAEGTLLGAYGDLGSQEGQLSYPFDLACAPDGEVFVAEFNNNRVSVFDAEGRFVRVMGMAGTQPGEFNQPWSLTVDAQGRLLVSDTRNNRVQIIQASKPAPRTVARAAPESSKQAEGNP